MQAPGFQLKPVMPAKAGIQGLAPQHRSRDSWIPAFAGMTPESIAIQSQAMAV
jgi:hypothetical protein